MVAVAPTLQGIPPTSFRKPNLWTDKILPGQNSQNIKTSTKSQLLRFQSLTASSLSAMAELVLLKKVKLFVSYVDQNKITIHSRENKIGLFLCHNDVEFILS